ncbi:MAG: hypothetical protein Q8K72_13955, partial [Acidimicrobiales bacterium]|nr:hypothetical protein [Acidimicrobiales bacterium]
LHPDADTDTETDTDGSADDPGRPECKGPPPWAGPEKRSMTREEKAAAQADRAAICGDEADDVADDD